TSASFAPFSIPATKADMATKLDTPRMIPSMVSSERNLCAQISRNPAMTVVLSWAEEWRTRSVGGLRSCDFMGNTKHQKPKTKQIPNTKPQNAEPPHGLPLVFGA